MSRLRRYFEPGRYCFITAVTHNRVPILINYRELLQEAVVRTRRKYDFDLIAWVLLPDHFHALLQAPNGDVPEILQAVKLSFVRLYGNRTGHQGRIWQRRYWDHIIRSQDDLNRHIDYIHYNPVKHRFVERASDWGDSSFDSFVLSGHYDVDWRADDAKFRSIDFGE